MGTLGWSPLLGGAGRRCSPAQRTLCSHVRYLMLVIMFFLTVCRAEDRRPYHMLTDTYLGQGRRHGGGATSYSTIRKQGCKDYMNIEEARGEGKSLHLMKKEGYNPGAKFREDNVIWSWNCQMANPTRIRLWSAELKGAIILMQGTQRTYDSQRGERTL